MTWRVACNLDRDPHVGTHLVKNLAIRVFGVPTPFNGKPEGPFVEKICTFVKTVPIRNSG